MIEGIGLADAGHRGPAYNIMRSLDFACPEDVEFHSMSACPLWQASGDRGDWISGRRAQRFGLQQRGIGVRGKPHLGRFIKEIAEFVPNRRCAHTILPLLNRDPIEYLVDSR